MSIVRTENLTKSYGDTKVLTNLNLSVDGSGQIVGILGPNGVGKTTLLEILTGQQPQDGGEANVLSYSLPEESQSLKYDIGILPEKEAPPSFLTAEEFLTFVGKDRGLSEETINDRIEYWSELLQFEEVLNVLGSDLSRGQQQKVMISQAFLHEPELVFIDEPLANLDPIIQSIFKDKLQRYVEDKNNTVIVSTHQVDFALDVCSELHLLALGRKDPHIYIDSPTEKTSNDIVSLLKKE